MRILKPAHRQQQLSCELRRELSFSLCFLLSLFIMHFNLCKLTIFNMLLVLFFSWISCNKCFLVISSSTRNNAALTLLVLNEDKEGRLLDVLDSLNMPKIFVKPLQGDDPPPSVGDIQRSTSSESASFPYSIPTTKKSKIFGGLSIDELGSKVETKLLQQHPGDLNGIAPATPLLFAGSAALMSFICWQVTSFLAAHFAVQFLDSEVYPLQRTSVVARNVVVGLAALLSGFSGVVALGLLLLGGAVTIGVLKGDLDPNKKDETQNLS
jgi:hypothetical protein